MREAVQTNVLDCGNRPNIVASIFQSRVNSDFHNSRFPQFEIFLFFPGRSLKEFSLIFQVILAQGLC